MEAHTKGMKKGYGEVARRNLKIARSGFVEFMRWAYPNCLCGEIVIAETVPRRQPPDARRFMKATPCFSCYDFRAEILTFGGMKFLQ